MTRITMLAMRPSDGEEHKDEKAEEDENANRVAPLQRALGLALIALLLLLFVFLRRLWSGP